MEILGTIILSSFFTIAFILPTVLSKGFQFHFIITPAIFLVLSFYAVFFAFLRARFVRKGGYCVITPEVIQSVCSGKTKTYEYKGRSLSARKRKNGSMDIYIGRNPIDLFKFGFGKNYFKTVLAGLGLGAPLYNVVNGDEALEYIKRHGQYGLRALWIILATRTFFEPKACEAYKALAGNGDPLYTVTNHNEVIDFLQRYK